MFRLYKSTHKKSNNPFAFVGIMVTDGLAIQYVQDLALICMARNIIGPARAGLYINDVIGRYRYHCNGSYAVTSFSLQ